MALVLVTAPLLPKLVTQKGVLLGSRLPGMAVFMNNPG